MKLQEIYAYLQEKAPLDLAESWDNSGMLIKGQENVEKILLTMDVTSPVVEEAVEKGCQLIISHHPVIFRPLKALNASDFLGQLIKHDISVISMHTNLDRADGGVNDTLARLIGLKNIEIYAELGRMGELDQPMTMREFADRMAKLMDTTVKYTLPDKMVKKVAMIGGAAGEFWTEAKACGVDVYISGEASHHHCLDAMEEDVAILVGGHWNTERPVLFALKKEMEAELGQIQVEVAQKDQDPFCYC